MEHTVLSYLKYLNIPVSRKYCEKLIASHPDYPSLLSVADTLERLGIPYNVARIGKEKTASLAFPYLLHHDAKGGGLAFVKNKKDLESNKSDWEHSDAIVLQAEPVDAIADEENNRQRSKETVLHIVRGMLFFAVTGCLVLSAIQNVSWTYISLLITAVGGMIVGYLLTAKDLGVRYNRVEEFCNTGIKTSCDVVLNSESARLLGPVKLSDVVMSYFTFQLIVAGFVAPLIGGSSAYIWVMAALSTLTIPVMLYTLYVQAVKTKAWCQLCLLVDVILVLQAGLYGYMVYGEIVGMGDVSLQPVAFSAFLFMAVGSSVILLKNNMKAEKESAQNEVTANRIKYSASVFTHLLTQEESVNPTLFKHELLIGNADAPVNILMAASLSCGPCKKGFEQVARLVAVYPDKVSVAVRFRHSKNNGQTSRYILRYWLEQIRRKGNQSSNLIKMLQDWYALMDLDKFIKKYPAEVNGDSVRAQTLEKQQDAWFEQTAVKGTPTFFINDYRLPKHYHINDMMILVPSLAGIFKRSKVVTREADSAGEIG